MKKLAIVTVAYNAEKNLSFFLPSIEKNREMIHGVYFVDNNSSDNTVSILKSWKKIVPVTVIQNSKNYGYAHAINIGIQKALDDGFDYLCITNNDIVFDEGFFAQMISDAESCGADAVGVPASINESELGFGYNLDADTLLPRKDLPIKKSFLRDEISKDSLPHIGAPHGGTILFSRNFFDVVGLYDPRLFFGGDELDFLYRISGHNATHSKKIICVVSLKSFFKIDNLTKHNAGNKLIKAKGMLQGNARVYMKHRFSPSQSGLYKEQYNLIRNLSKGSLVRYLALFLFSIRGLCIEIPKYYFARAKKTNS